MQWKYYYENVAPGESVLDLLTKAGRDGWEMCGLDRDERGWRTVYFKKPVG